MAHHEPFSALGPIDWSDVPTDGLAEFLMTTFSESQTIIDSVPIPTNAPAAVSEQKTGRARAHTDAGVMSNSAPDLSRDRAPDHAARLQKEWKEVKVNAKENPLGITVYKLAAKDGRGAWFARRSLHEGVSFDKFKLCLEREFDESMKNTTKDSPGKGAIRGIGAEQKLENEVCHGVGKVEVFVLSAQFPGPTTPRDFVTLLLTSDAGAGLEQKEGGKQRKRTGRYPRQFMIVSKPCNHPECQPRQGFIRGVYESVEIIREVPVDKPLRRVRSSIDMSSPDVDFKQEKDAGLGKEAMLRSAMKASSSNTDDSSKKAISFAPSESMPTTRTGSPAGEAEPEMAVEWIMITRSDPGGSVPRFMIEKGTPGGIVNDAGRFLKWLASKDPENFGGSGANETTKAAVESEKGLQSEGGQSSGGAPGNGKVVPTSNLATRDSSTVEEGPGGFYGMIAGALGAASSYAAGLVSGTGQTTDSEQTDEKYESDTESERSFASAEEGEPAAATLEDQSAEAASARSVHSEESRATSVTASQHEKDLKKLQDRQRKIQEKITKNQERDRAKSKEDNGAALAKLREKHEKEIAKQEEKYQKELKKLEEKRKQDEKKAEERRRKQAEKEEKNNTAMELERVKVERDMALKQVEILKDQIGELQSQNTMLVAKLGKLGALGQEEEKAANNGSAVEAAAS